MSLEFFKSKKRELPGLMPDTYHNWVSSQDMYRSILPILRTSIADPLTEPSIKRSPEETKALIEEIHHSFYTEVDRLLENAKIQYPTESTKQELIDKVERLRKLGFTSTKEVKAVQSELTRIESAKYNNKMNKELADTINYFSFKYPNYKFITENAVIGLCEKYNLIYGTIDKFIGHVPDKNLKQMEDFKIDPIDEAAIEVDSYSPWGTRGNMHYVHQQSIVRSKEAFDGTRINPAPLEICAPASDFDMNRMEVKGRRLVDKIEVPDPVVLQPVMYNNVKHYLIVTAWGIEAEDELVVNQKMN